MKIFQKIVPYKLKRLIPMAMIAGLPLMPTGCCKHEPDKKNEPTVDVSLEFDSDNGDKIVTFEILQNYANDENVRNIYLVPVNNWGNAYASNITFMRNNFLQPRLNISNKVRGRGDFTFKVGEASKVPDDSLWYVKNGWTINKRLQK